MAGVLLGDPSHHGVVEGSPYRFSNDRGDEADRHGSTWYLSRRDIEENSPSRRDGIDLKKETYFRKSYCTYLQDLGMRLKVPQVTIATAIVFCHRFFLRQSHAKNDRRTIATVCMFLAGKVEETPRPLKDVILVSYEIIHKKDPAAAQRIKQREVYEQQKELILLGERVVLATLGFDLNVHHPYKPLVEAIKKFKVAQNALAQVAWNFVNDGLRTSLCLQFKSHHIAAGAIFLAAKFLKVKLPSDGEKVWWQEFDVTPRQLEEVSNQMLELYEQNRAVQQPSHGNETEGSSAAGSSHRAPVKAPAAAEDPSSQSEYIPASGVQTNPTTRPLPDQPQPHSDKLNGESGLKDRRNHELGNVPEASTSRPYPGSERPLEELGDRTEGPRGHSPMVDAIKKIDKDKVKAALEKRRKSRPEVARRVDIMDEDDLIERELESGIELGSGDEKMRQERRLSWPPNPDRGAESGIGGTEEGEFHSAEPTSRKRELPHHHVSAPPPSKHRESLDDARAGRLERAERDHKRQRHENQV